MVHRPQPKGSNTLCCQRQGTYASSPVQTSFHLVSLPFRVTTKGYHVTTSGCETGGSNPGMVKAAVASGDRPHSEHGLKLSSANSCSQIRKRFFNLWNHTTSQPDKKEERYPFGEVITVSARNCWSQRSLRL
jgi:hypothetical protein